MGMKAELTARQQYWLEHVDTCERSGQTTKAYAESNQLSVSMLYSWRRDLVRMGVWPGSGKGRPVRFDRVELAAGRLSTSEWRIILANGVEVGFSGTVEGATLSTVLEAARRL